VRLDLLRMGYNIPVANHVGCCADTGKCSRRAPNLISLNVCQRRRFISRESLYLLHHTSGLGVMPNSQLLRDGSNILFQYCRDKSIYVGMNEKAPGNLATYNTPFRRASRELCKPFERPPNPFPTHSPCLFRIRPGCPNSA
jgi:hypothetical protein